MKQDVATHFEGLLIMLQSVSVELDESTKQLKKRKQEDHAEKIFEELLDELIRLLHYFKLASKSLDPFNTPTLHLVGMWLAKLKAHLQPRDEPVTVKGTSGEKMTIPADSEDTAKEPSERLWLHSRADRPRPSLPQGHYAQSRPT
jgi:hypothetical protein